MRTILLLSLFFTFIFFVQTLGASFDGTKKGLRMGFYDPTCPQAEEIVRETVADHFMFDPDIPAGLIRLFFHDCFVRGCDASILLDETPSGSPVEKASPANGHTLHGLEVIDNAKHRLESLCPATVSCADILAFAARDAVVLAGLPPYPVPAGRRDGTVSIDLDILFNLPPPSASVQVLNQMFAKKGLSQREMVILSGAHSIGGAHCSSFNYRLYNFTENQPQDPILDIFYAEYLKFKCPQPGSFLAQFAGADKVEFDAESKLRLDASYYKGLEKGKGLLTSDQALMEDRRTRKVVRRMAKDPKRWAKQFGRAMVKLGAVDVLVGDQGEVRRTCRFVN